MAITLAPLFLLAVPLIEISVFVLVGSQIGVLATIGLVVATAILGSILLRIQGFGVLARIRDTMDAGGVPGRDLVHGLMIMLAGLLLLTPGFFTDTIGLLLFVPAIRDFAWRLIRSRIVVMDATAGQGGAGARNSHRRGRTIDLDADEYETEPKPRRDPQRLDDDR